MKRNLLSVAFVVATSGFLTAQTVIDSLSFTGGIQTFTVPCGVTSLTIETMGAQGGAGATGGNGALGGFGGLGGYSSGTLAVSPGDVLNIFVGGAGATPTGGFNGGGNGGSQNAGGGGGATDVRVGGTAEANRVLTAGGGGGGGRGGCETGTVAGGSGSGGGSNVAGANGTDAPTPGGVAGGGFGGNFGAVQGAAGGAGIGCGGFLGAPGGTATTGSGAAGGAGQSCCCFTFGSIPAGGGGGGGQLGGGGGGGGSAGTTGCSGNDKGAGGGGGGGSSFTGGVTNPNTIASSRSGNGVVIITYTLPTPVLPTIVGQLTLCQNDTASYSISADPNATFYTWTVDSSLTFVSGQNTTNITVVGSVAGTYAIAVVGVNGTCSLTGPQAVIMVTVNPSPNVAATATSSSICIGASDTLSATGANASYTWTPGNLTGSPVIVAPVVTTTFTVVGTDSLGCSNTTTVVVNVNNLPTVTFTTQPNVCLADDTLSLAGSPSGGTFSGTAVVGTSFNPTTAGVGSFAITYNYTDVNGCSASATDTVDVSPCTSTNDINNPFNITLMPNPVTEVLVVNWNSNKATVKTLEVYDNTGRLVLSQVVTSTATAEMNVNELPSGNYNLVVKTNDKSATYGFVKK